SPQEFNVTAYGATALAIVTLEAFPGMCINTFIVCVLCIAWVKKKILNSCEKILLLLGCSRFCYLCISWVYYFLSIIYRNYIHVHPTLQLILSFQSFFNYSNLWVSACLCGFYCIKIANFRNRFFFYLKVKIDRIVPWLLLGSMLSAFTIVIIAFNIAENMHNESHNISCLGNFWEASVKMDKYLFPIYFLMGFEYAAPFLAVIFSALFLLSSLWRHKCKMQTNSMNSLSMDAHIKAMKSILSFFVMYSMNFVCLVLTIIYANKNEYTIMFLISMYLCAFPGVHSLILIFSNPKLEKTLLKILSCVKCK
ncbi:T2R41 protein, partial [Grantiella picta]|nr:T2R41 protein [Grantiella picta]